VRRTGLIFVVVAIAVVLTGSAWADHVINFTNGTSLPVRAYNIEDGMIHVDLGGNAFMAFPMELVDQIENPRRSLNLKPSTMHPDDVGPMIATSGYAGSGSRGGGAKTSSTPKGPTSKNPGSYKGNQPQVSSQRYSQEPTRFAVADSGAANLNNSRGGGGGGLRGAQRVGDHFVMPGQRAGREKSMDVEFRGAGQRPLPPGFNPPNSGADPPKQESGSGK